MNTPSCLSGEGSGLLWCTLFHKGGGSAHALPSGEYSWVCFQCLPESVLWPWLHCCQSSPVGLGVVEPHCIPYWLLLCPVRLGLQVVFPLLVRDTSMLPRAVSVCSVILFCLCWAGGVGVTLTCLVSRLGTKGIDLHPA